MNIELRMRQIGPEGNPEQLPEGGPEQIKSPEAPEDIERHPDEFAALKGREIAGLPVRKETFLVLAPGRDYEGAQLNSSVESNCDWSRLIAFIYPGIDESQYDDVISLDIKAPHWRSVSFTGKEPESAFVAKYLSGYYFNANIKGCGFTKPSVKEGHHLSQYETWTPTEARFGNNFVHFHTLGIAPGQEFLLSGLPVDFKDNSIVTFSKYLAESGIRTELYWSVVRLKKIPYQGEIYSVEQLKQIGVLPDYDDFEPHIGVRLFRTNTRIAEALDSEERRASIFHEALNVYGLERNMEQGLVNEYGALINDNPEESKNLFDPLNKEDQKEFFMNFCYRLGKNLGLLISDGFSHKGLHSANITMAAEYADIGTMTHLDCFSTADRKKYFGVHQAFLKDIRDSAFCIKLLRKAAVEHNNPKDPNSYISEIGSLELGSKDQWFSSFMRAFEDNLDQGGLEELTIKKEDLVSIANRIFRGLFIDDLKFKGLRTGKISPNNWPL